VSLKDGQALRQIESDAYVASSVAVADDGMAYVGHYGNVVMGLNPKTATVLWRYRDRNFPYLSSAAVSSDRVVIGGNDKRLHCLNRADGTMLWQVSTRGKIDGSPVICGDAVIVGSLDGRIYCVSMKDGSERWTYELGAPVVASPAVSDGWIIIGAEDGSVYGLHSNPSKP
jgi:outer membrane protein assembly factor BamB